MKFELGDAVEILSATPPTLNSLLGGLSDDWTASYNDRENWQAFDVVGHLIHCEETDWVPRARLILGRSLTVREDSPMADAQALPYSQASAGLPVFEPFDRLAQFERSKGKSLADLLGEFEQWRERSLTEMRSWNLTDEQLELKAMHPELGEVTLSQLLATWTVHDLNHIRQIATSIAKRYDTEVGPWKEYLGILK